MFEEFNPHDDKILCIYDKQGKLLNKKWHPDLSDEQVLEAWKKMFFARTADMMAVSYQRQGRMYTYPPNYGQEAVSAPLGFLMKEDDWLVPAFREMGAWLAKGASLKEIFMNFMGYEQGGAFSNVKNMMPLSVPISSQLLHAAGIGYSIKFRGTKDVVFTFVGDGGTSEGDFHEALNYAAVWKIPVIFIVQNNQFAISVPFKKQTASVNIAVKAVAYGMPGIKVDGNDFFAMYAAINHASEFARNGNGPVLIEALTYRRGAHTTSDDPTKYRTREEEEFWAETDPLNRLKLYLIKKKMWSESLEAELTADYKKEVDRQFAEAEAVPDYPLGDIFNYMYKDVPDDLKNQQREYEKFLKWKEGRK